MAPATPLRDTGDLPREVPANPRECCPRTEGKGHAWAFLPSRSRTALPAATARSFSLSSNFSSSEALDQRQALPYSQKLYRCRLLHCSSFSYRQPRRDYNRLEVKKKRLCLVLRAMYRQDSAEKECLAALFSRPTAAAVAELSSSRPWPASFPKGPPCTCRPPA